MDIILAATDFSRRSDVAATRAALLARQTGATLELVNAVDDDRKQAIIDAETAIAARQLHEEAARLAREPGAEDIRTSVVVGDPFQGLASAADASRPRVVVLGAHRRRLLRDVFVGTTAQRIIRQARWPVLMVNAPAATGYRRALFATDLSAASRAALLRLGGLGLVEPDACGLLHVFDAPASLLTLRSVMQTDEMDRYIAEERTRAEQALAKFALDLPAPDRARLVYHHSGSFAHGILEAAARQEADLVIVASHGRTAVSRALQGSVSEEVLRRARCDVLVIPPLPQD